MLIFLLGLHILSLDWSWVETAPMPRRTQCYMYCLWDWSWVETAPEEHNICTVFGTGLGWKLPQKNTILVWKGFNNEAAISLSSFLLSSCLYPQARQLTSFKNITSNLHFSKQNKNNNKKELPQLNLSTIWI